MSIYLTVNLYILTLTHWVKGLSLPPLILPLFRLVYALLTLSKPLLLLPPLIEFHCTPLKSYSFDPCPTLLACTIFSFKIFINMGALGGKNVQKYQPRPILSKYVFALRRRQRCTLCNI